VVKWEGGNKLTRQRRSPQKTRTNSKKAIDCRQSAIRGQKLDHRRSGMSKSDGGGFALIRLEDWLLLVTALFE